MIYIYEIIIYILEITTSLYINTSLFIPLFGYIYICNIALNLKENKSIFIFSVISGIIYDLCVTMTPFINTILFPLINFILLKIKKSIPKNKLTFVIIFLLEIFLYRTFTYLFIILINYQIFSISKYISSIINSIIINFIFLVILNKISYKQFNKN
jgi:cell shape-determining protein MreD